MYMMSMEYIHVYINSNKISLSIEAITCKKSCSRKTINLTMNHS